MKKYSAKISKERKKDCQKLLEINGEKKNIENWKEKLSYRKIITVTVFTESLLAPKFG